MPKVFVFSRAGDPNVLKQAGCELVIGKEEWLLPGGNNEPEMSRLAQNAHALMGHSIRNSPITRNILTASPELRIVAKTTVGVDDIDVDAATELGILVTHAPVESNWGNVAENTVAYILAFAKRVRERDAEIKSGGWRRSDIRGFYVGSRGSDGYEGITLGIIGLGRIGGRVAQLMRPWNIRILAYDPHIPDYRFLEFGVKAVDKETLLRESDFVTVHVVLNRETRHMISTNELAIMKRTAFLINTARGGTVDEAALAHALERDGIAGAAIDCFEVEPVPQESPLRRMGDKVILTPHGGLSMPRTAEGGLGGGPVWASESVLDALHGKVPDHVFNTEAIALWQQRFGGKSVIEERARVTV